MLRVSQYHLSDQDTQGSNQIIHYFPPFSSELHYVLPALLETKQMSSYY